MAFKVAYEAILAALPPGSIPKWRVSVGHSLEGRAEAIKKVMCVYEFLHDLHPKGKHLINNCFDAWVY